MFYIEGTFYNDMREAAAVDYSYPIRAFCHTHGLDPPPRPPAAAAAARTRGGGAESDAAERQGGRGAQPGDHRLGHCVTLPYQLRLCTAACLFEGDLSSPGAGPLSVHP